MLRQVSDQSGTEGLFLLHFAVYTDKASVTTQCPENDLEQSRLPICAANSPTK